MEQELISAIKDTMRSHVFDTADTVCNILHEKFNIPQRDIKYEMVNGINELTIKIPGAIDKVDVKFTILPEEIIFN